MQGNDRALRPTLGLRIHVSGRKILKRGTELYGALEVKVIALLHTRKPRQFRKRQVHAEAPGLAAIVLNTPARCLIKQGRIKKLQQKRLRMHIGRNHASANLATIIGHDSGRLALIDQDLRDSHTGLDFNALGLGKCEHGLCDGTHAPSCGAPGTRLAVHLSERMVQQHISGPRLIGIREISNDPFKPPQALERLALEPAVKIVAKRGGHELRKYSLILGIQLPKGIAGAHQA